jgi:hypothetical protein
VAFNHPFEYNLSTSRDEPKPEEKGKTISIENPERSGALALTHDVTRAESTGQTRNRIAEEKICPIREFQKCLQFSLASFVILI